MRLSERQFLCGSKEECAHILSGVAKASSRCCELANPAQVRQIASQTGDLLRQMRFVASRGAAAKSHREDVAGRGRCWRDGAKRKSERKSLPLRRRRCNAADAQKTLRCNRCTEAVAVQQMHRSRCDATDAQKPLRCNRCTEAVAMQQMRRSRCDAADAQKQLRWVPERKDELAPIVGTEKATRHRGL